jgi:hypothetical protein
MAFYRFASTQRSSCRLVASLQSGTFLAHYLGDDGKVDEKRVANDFATCAPIAARVEELKLERASNAARHK